MEHGKTVVRESPRTDMNRQVTYLDTSEVVSNY